MVRTFDMFCGGGGSGRGAEMAGAKIVGAFDRCKLAAKTYRLNFPKARVYQMMASSLSPARVSRELGKIDLLLA
jgi:DNA (cytosine-5)-methyltransferase 1